MFTLVRLIEKFVVVSFGLIVFTILSCSTGEDLASIRGAAERGDAEAQVALGLMYHNGDGVEPNCAEAVRWFRKAADQGYHWGQFNLGVMYNNGEGIEQDYSEAVKWYRKAVKQGSASAQINLGIMYYNGNGVEKNYAEAVKWYRKAAEQGYANAQSNLGLMYRNGEGVEADNSEAFKWFRKAAEQGDANAQSNLGFMYKNGEGVEKDDSAAVKWLSKAAGQGDVYCQNGLAYMYANGLGIERNYTEAVKWCRKAVEQGHADAQKNLDIYAAREAENIAKTEHVQNRESEAIKDGFKNFAWGTNFENINSVYPLEYVGVNKGLRQVKQYESGIKSLGGAQIDVCIFEFYKDKFFGIWVQAKNCHDSQKLRKALEKVYGKPDDGGLDMPMFEMNSWNSSKTSRIFSFDISKCIGNLFLISEEVAQELQKDEKRDLEIAKNDF